MDLQRAAEQRSALSPRRGFARALIYLTTPEPFKQRGCERRRRSQPPAQGCARERATLGNWTKIRPNPERVAKAPKTAIDFDNSFRVQKNSMATMKRFTQPFQGCVITH